MNFIKRIVNGLLGVFLIWFGLQNLLVHFGVINDKEQGLCIELIEEGGTAIATYDMDKSKEVTTKIKGVPTGTSYRLIYSFDANGQKYLGEQETKELPTALKTRVTYIKSDPSKNMINPQAKLAILKELRGSSRDILIGIGAMLIGLFLVGRRFMEFKRNKAENEDLSMDQLTTAGISDSSRSKTTDSKFGSATTNSSLPPPPRFRKESNSETEKLGGKESSNSVSRSRVESDIPSTIKRDELLANSKKTFGETDHSRFIPPQASSKFEEE